MKKIIVIDENGMRIIDHFKTETVDICDDGSGGTTLKFKAHRHLNWKPSDELDAIPLGTAEEERARAKIWMDTAAQNRRDANYWRDKRAYQAEEAVRLLRADWDELAQAGWDGNFKYKMPEQLEKLVAHIMSWPRPENPERFHQVDSKPVPPTSFIDVEFGVSKAE